MGLPLIINRGGTRSSKTFSIIQLLIIIGRLQTKPFLISIVSESLPHLKRGCIETLKKVLGPAFDENKWNKSELQYQLTEYCRIEFFSANDSSKLRGAERDILFINECNNITHESFKELTVRTIVCTFVDYNPVAPFYIDKYITKGNYIHSTYLDARDYLPKKIVDDIESRRGDINWWRVFGLGLVGNIHGVVYPNFTVIPDNQYPISSKGGYGLDWGFSSDPTAITRCLIKADHLYLHEMLYKTGLTNQPLSDTMEELGIRKFYDEIIADSEDPKSIEELSELNWEITGALKGPGSVREGIKKCQAYKLFVTESSLNLIYELRQYLYVELHEDAEGNMLYGEKTKGVDHLIDSFRYYVFTKTAGEQKIDYEALAQAGSIWS